jgi:hypothetical protein
VKKENPVSKFPLSKCNLHRCQKGRFECYFEPTHEPACEATFKGLANKFKGVAKKGSGGAVYKLNPVDPVA